LQIFQKYKVAFFSLPRQVFGYSDFSFVLILHCYLFVFVSTDSLEKSSRNVTEQTETVKKETLDDNSVVQERLPFFFLFRFPQEWKQGTATMLNIGVFYFCCCIFII
jgi:hypothetical protein